MPHKRTPIGQKNQEQRKADYDLLQTQKRIAWWLIDGSRFRDEVTSEQAATVPAEYVLDYISDCHSDPDPRCVPFPLDGLVLHNSAGDGFSDLARQRVDVAEDTEDESVG